MKISGKKYNIKSQEVKVFLALLSAGLWEKERLAQGYTSEIDWDVVISLSREQAMLPLVGNGIDISTGNLSDGLTREQKKAISAYMVLCNAWRIGRIFPSMAFKLSLKGLTDGVTDLADGR